MFAFVVVVNDDDVAVVGLFVDCAVTVASVVAVVVDEEVGTGERPDKNDRKTSALLWRRWKIRICYYHRTKRIPVVRLCTMYKTILRNLTQQPSIKNKQRSFFFFKTRLILINFGDLQNSLTLLFCLQ